MTVHREKINALKRTRDFLRDLMDRTKTKRIPSEIRKAAYWCLRHYPSNWDIAIKPDFPTKAELKAFDLLADTKDEDHQDSSSCTQPSPSQKPHKRKPK